jgi:phosphoribosylglycinamide formyltransferase-1
MANIAVFASGNGSNFEALAKEFQNDEKNRIVMLICNKKNAFVLQRSEKFNIKCQLINYLKDGKDGVESRIADLLKDNSIDIVFLAGFMKILSPGFIKKTSIPIVNIHPSLLPEHKGCDAIKKAYEASDSKIGITIHYVNEEVDGGDIILQKSIPLDKTLTLDEVEKQIHELEHKYYSIVARNLCNGINSRKNV